MIYRSKILGISLKRRKTRRRFLVCYWMVLLLFLFIPDLLPSNLLHPTLPAFMLVLALVTPLLWITIRLWGINPGQAFTRDFEDRYADTGEGDYPPIDEREKATRDHASYLALRFIRIAFVVVAFGSSLISEKLSSRVKVDASWVLFLLMWILPQTIVLWTEPDMEVEG